MSIQEIAILLAIGLAAGLMSSMVGIGGGIVIVPLLGLAFGLDQKVAQGTSLALLLLPIGLLGVLVYHKAGHVRWNYALVMCITFFIGSYFGSRLVQGLDSYTVKRIFAVFMILIALKYLFFDKPNKPAAPAVTEQQGFDSAQPPGFDPSSRTHERKDAQPPADKH